MALGNSGIASAREVLATVRSNVDHAMETNRQFMNMYQNEDFQMFVNDTKIGANINAQLTELSKWISELCSSVNSTISVTQSMLIQQEQDNMGV